MRILPAGPRALLVELDALASVLALHAEVGRRRQAGWAPSLVDVVPGGRTVLLDGIEDPVACAREMEAWEVPPFEPESGPEVEIEVVYDGEDLAEVARRWGVEPEEAARRHAAASYRVAFCGFAPGFAYMSGLPGELAVPRRRTPRPAVPAGAVALAGAYTGIYPRPSPGGWQLVGRTDAVLWDPGRRPAALLAPGTRVRFAAVGG